MSLSARELGEGLLLWGTSHSLRRCERLWRSSGYWSCDRKPVTYRPGVRRKSSVIPQADVVAITGTALINHTFGELVSLCRPDAYVIVLGGSTPLSPVLFHYGVHAVSGTRVVDIPAVLQAVSQGATFRQIPGKRLLTMELQVGEG